MAKTRYNQKQQDEIKRGLKLKEKKKKGNKSQALRSLSPG